MPRGAAARESLLDLLRDIARKRFAEGAGLFLLTLAILLALALMSWSVRDPSFNYAVDGPVRNWLGHPGAVVADVAVQLLGVAILAVVVPLGCWGLMLFRARGMDRIFGRVTGWAVGILAAAAFVSLLPRADSWPLPTGLGGAIGDAIERLPLMLIGTSGIAKLTAALLFAGVAIVSLHAAIGRDLAFDGDEAEDSPRVRRHSDLDEDDHRDDEPSRALVLVGAAVHGLALLARSSARAARRFRDGAGSRIAEGARSMVERATRDEKAAFASAGGPNLTPLRNEPPLRREPFVSREDMSDVAAPVYHRRGPLPAEEMASPNPQPAKSAGYGAAVAALQQAAKRRLGLAAAEPEAPTRVIPPIDGASVRPGERAAIEALQAAARRRMVGARVEPVFSEPADARAASRVIPPAQSVKPGKREAREAQPDLLGRDAYELPPLSLLNEPKRSNVVTISEDALEQNARLLEGVLDDFGVKGEIINVRPGPVVTLYELEPAPGTKSSRVIGLADDIARSMSAVSARVAVVPGRNAIGIELPNQRRETVYFRELIGSQDFEKSSHKLALSMGKTIGGEPVIAELAKMPHLLVAGTTGSGKSVAINTMILSLLYRLTPAQCRLIMIDPKMLELSVYDGIPHLLTPVVTDPKKAVVALKWAVREMEDRYRKMSKVGVRNIDGFNARVAEAKADGEIITRTVQSGFDKETGEILYTQEEMPLDTLPYIVVLIDEMADLMMVAGKDIEGAVQRLAQMARAAGIHVIMATQRPSVDVITGTIKANFPTRISFQVTSKIDSRTILGEMGAEQLLGQGDMLYMAGGGRINRVHGPFVSDEEVERVVNHLKRQGKPQYLDSITREDEEEMGAEGDEGAVFDKGEFGSEDGGDLYEQAVRVVLRDKKASTSYIQRRLQIGYNRAASLMERMEQEGVVGAANHAGKREILVEGEE
ncbi:MAG: DNA translocase FtsK 4TM domain-containing protein [Methylocystis sp.]|nr:DNA translocase FtsK 4TM domain-containing protein [Methylocystis sp.]MCA3583239.1 DNA translocase FtsK 4TM domain-containing protein [Methylocystis sp.]MCA3587556.1 DNA translocase FtsK 4TM domain-containing protein [Methylocystis sp.]MCA3590683.1 DNA translocase FtsK 4TM domain-containing protein [Methylocystis sp.]